MAEKTNLNLYATLFVRPVFETGTNKYYVWELILFSGTSPWSLGNFVGSGRFGSQNDAIRKAEYYAKLLNIEIDRKSLRG